MKKIISVILSCMMLASVFTVAASAQGGKTYYLFGYINGKNYACEEDYTSMGDYRFENGTLSASFNSVSYVAVKEADNACWYMTDGWQGEVSSVTLYDTNITGTGSNKLMVPANAEITFTLTENGDGSLTLSYTADYGEEIRTRLWEYVNEDLHHSVLVPGSDWTDESFAPFKAALDAANATLENLNSTDSELSAAYENLKAAEKRLAPADEEYWRGKLSALTAEYSADFENIDALYALYTSQSVDTYKRAYQEANELLKKALAYKYELSTAYNHLKNYRKGLTPKKTDFTLPDGFEEALGKYAETLGVQGIWKIGDPYEREIGGKKVVEYGGLRFFTTEGVIVFGLSDNLCTVGEEIIGDYKFQNPIWDSHPKNPSGYCVFDGSEVCSAAEAVAKGMFTPAELAEIIPFAEKIALTTEPVTEPKETETVTEPQKPTMPVVVPTMPDTDPSETGIYLPETTAPTEPTTTAAEPTTAPTEAETYNEPFKNDVIGELRDGYKLCYFYMPSPPWMEAFYTVYGKYVIVNFNGIENHGFSVTKGSEIIALSEAFEKGITDIEEVASIIRSKEIPNFNANNFINTEEEPYWKIRYSDYHFRQDDVPMTLPIPTTAPTEPTTTAAEPTTAPTEATTAPTEPTTAAPTTVPATPEKPKPVKKAQSVKLSAKTITVKAAKAKKARQVILNAVSVRNSFGKLSFEKVSGSKYLSITKTGKIVLKKGKYRKNAVFRLRVRVSAKGNALYKPVTKTVIAKVKIK